MAWTKRRDLLRTRHVLAGAGCLLLLLFCALRGQAAVERLTIGGYPTLDLTRMRDPADPADPPTWAWDSQSSTLTLEGYSGPGIAFYSSTGLDTITLVFAGQNAVQAADGHGLFANCNLVLRAASYSTQDKITCRGGGSLGAGILTMSGMQGRLTIECGTVAGFGAFPEGAQGAGGVGIQAQQVEIGALGQVIARGGDGQLSGGNGLYATDVLELTGRGARLDALGGHSAGMAGDGVVCAGGGMYGDNATIYTTGGDGAQPGNGLRHTAGHAFAVENGYLTATPGNWAGGTTVHGLSTGGDFRVSGGTHLINGGIQTPTRGLVISGGSLRTAAADIMDAEGRMVLPTDALGNEVYLTRPAVSGGAWASIDTIYFRRNPPGGYRTDGLVANAVGRLFLWLPAGTAINGVASGRSEHAIDPALVTSQDNGARGNGYVVTGEDGLLPDPDDDGPLTVLGGQEPTIGQLTQPAAVTRDAQAAQVKRAENVRDESSGGAAVSAKSSVVAKSGSGGSVGGTGSDAGVGNGSATVGSERAAGGQNLPFSATGQDGQAAQAAAANNGQADAGQALTAGHGTAAGSGTGAGAAGSGNAAGNGSTGAGAAGSGTGAAAATTGNGGTGVAGIADAGSGAVGNGTKTAAAGNGGGGASGGHGESTVPPTGDGGHMEAYLLLLTAAGALLWGFRRRRFFRGKGRG